MTPFGFFGGGKRKKRPARSRTVANAIAAEQARNAGAVARFHKAGRTRQAFVTLVHELLSFYECSAMPQNPNASIYDQTDNLLSVAEVVVALDQHFGKRTNLNDEQMMAVSINELCDLYGISAGPAPVGPPAAPAPAPPRDQVVYPVGLRSMQQADGMLATVFGKFRRAGATPTAFAALVQALLRGADSPTIPSDPKRPIYQQTQHLPSIAAMVNCLQDEFAGDLRLTDAQLQSVSILDLIARCKLARRA